MGTPSRFLAAVAARRGVTSLDKLRLISVLCSLYPTDSVGQADPSHAWSIPRVKNGVFSRVLASGGGYWLECGGKPSVRINLNRHIAKAPRTGPGTRARNAQRHPTWAASAGISLRLTIVRRNPAHV